MDIPHLLHLPTKQGNLYQHGRNTQKQKAFLLCHQNRAAKTTDSIQLV